MARYGRAREDEKALRVMTLEEERRLVQRVMELNLIIGCYVGLLGETGLRKKEGLRLKWEYVNTKSRMLTVEASKNGKTRYVPLSDYALELLAKLPASKGVRRCSFGPIQSNRFAILVISFLRVDGTPDCSGWFSRLASFSSHAMDHAGRRYSECSRVARPSGYQNDGALCEVCTRSRGAARDRSATIGGPRNGRLA